MRSIVFALVLCILPTTGYASRMPSSLNSQFITGCLNVMNFAGGQSSLQTQTNPILCNCFKQGLNAGNASYPFNDQDWSLWVNSLNVNQNAPTGKYSSPAAENLAPGMVFHMMGELPNIEPVKSCLASHNLPLQK